MGVGPGFALLAGARLQPCLYPHALSALSHALGVQARPTLWMTSQPRNPLELRRGKLDSGKTHNKIRLLRV